MFSSINNVFAECFNDSALPIALPTKDLLSIILSDRIAGSLISQEFCDEHIRMMIADVGIVSV